MLAKAIFTACAAGLISSLMQSAAVGKSGKKMMKLLVNTIVILSIVKPFTNGSTDLVLADITELEDQPFYNSLDSDFSEYYLAQAERSVREELEKRLNSEKIKCVHLGINCEIDEYHVITVGKVSAEVTDNESKVKLEKAVNEILPNTDVNITVVNTDDVRTEK